MMFSIENVALAVEKSLSVLDEQRDDVDTFDDTDVDEAELPL